MYELDELVRIVTNRVLIVFQGKLHRVERLVKLDFLRCVFAREELDNTCARRLGQQPSFSKLPFKLARRSESAIVKPHVSKHLKDLLRNKRIVRAPEHHGINFTSITTYELLEKRHDIVIFEMSAFDSCSQAADTCRA